MFTSRMVCPIYTSPRRERQQSTAAESEAKSRSARPLASVDEGSRRSRWCFPLRRKDRSTAGNPVTVEVRR
jgi:hypothetical protein